MAILQELKALGKAALDAARNILGGTKDAGTASAGWIGKMSHGAVGVADKAASFAIKTLRFGFEGVSKLHPAVAGVAATVALGLGLGKMWERHNTHVQQEKQIAPLEAQLAQHRLERNQNVASLPDAGDERIGGAAILARQQNRAPVLTGAGANR
jgi:hypothetical protein